MLRTLEIPGGTATDRWLLHVPADPQMSCALLVAGEGQTVMGHVFFPESNTG